MRHDEAACVLNLGQCLYTYIYHIHKHTLCEYMVCFFFLISLVLSCKQCIIIIPVRRWIVNNNNRNDVVLSICIFHATLSYYYYYYISQHYVWHVTCCTYARLLFTFTFVKIQKENAFNSFQDEKCILCTLLYVEILQLVFL